MCNFVVPCGADDSEALIISETMSRLCRLGIQGNSLTYVGLLAILDKCPFLQYLDVRECYNLYLTESLRKRFSEQIKHLRLPIRNKAYEEFVYEYDIHCISWQDSLDDDDSDDSCDPLLEACNDVE
jgi:F-box/leucine-rich repeat protein 2/20